ncbi:MAG: hypothetical protein ACQEXX_06910 [Bacillota bacterium]
MKKTSNIKELEQIKLNFGMLVLIILILSGCTKETKIEHPKFESKEAAINNYVEERNVKGTIIQLNLKSRDIILLTQESKEIYSLGEMIKIKAQYSLVGISAGVDIGNTSGAMWEFKTSNNNKYTIKISKDHEDPDSIYSKEMKLYISVVEGTRTYETQSTMNVIQSNEIIRDVN